MFRYCYRVYYTELLRSRAIRGTSRGRRAILSADPPVTRAYILCVYRVRCREPVNRVPAGLTRRVTRIVTCDVSGKTRGNPRHKRKGEQISAITSLLLLA